MESKIKISTLSEVKPFKYSWRVAVKVIHKWNSFSHQKGASLEMVLGDKNGIKIHAICKHSLLEQFESQFVVGEWKVITNFLLSSASGMNRPTNHVYKMELLQHTSITDCDFTSGDNMCLDLHEFGTIINGSSDSRFLIDVIGVIIDFGSQTVLQIGRKEVTKLVFTLGDINDHRLECCVSGSLAELLIKEANPKIGDICLIRFAKIVKFKDEWGLSNAFNSTLVFINPDINDAKSLKQKFHGSEITLENTQLVSNNILIQDKNQRWSKYPFSTIQEMKHSEKGGKCRVICSVYAIDIMDGWWYCACVVCQNKVFKSPISFDELDVPRWWCGVCQVNVTKVSPRYKLTLLVQDQTGESKFTLLDSVATYIVKKSAYKTVNLNVDKIEVQDILPHEIVDIVGKSYGFGISIDENNSSEVASFNAMKVWSLNDAIWKKTKSLHQNSIASKKKKIDGSG